MVTEVIPDGTSEIDASIFDRLSTLCDAEAGLIFSEFIKKIEAENLEITQFPEIPMLEFFKLYHPEKIRKSWLHQIASEPGSAKKILASLVLTGTYPREIIDLARREALQRIYRKRRRQEIASKLWRSLKVITILLPILRQLAGDGTLEGNVVNIIELAILWTVIDRMTADPLERKLARATGVYASLRWVFSPELPHSTQDYENIVSLRLGAVETQEQDIEVVKLWYERIQLLLEGGVAAQVILKMLQRRPFHSPFVHDIKDAETKIMTDIEVRYELLEEDAKRYIAEQQLDEITENDPLGKSISHAQEIERRNLERQKLAMQVVQEHLQ